MAKKHAPIEQLREAAKVAQKMLVDKGIHTPESAVDRILKENKVILPGIPAYLPHRWTLQDSRRFMRDILRLWEQKNKGSQRRQEKAEAFFSFLVKELVSIEEEAQKKVDNMPALLRKLNDVKIPVYKAMSAQQHLETVQAITRFMVDAFAVSMVVKEHHTTTQFAEWFMAWTLDLEDYWASKEKND